MEKIVIAVLAVILGIMIGMQFRESSNISFPMVEVGGYECQANGCLLVVRNAGGMEADCDNVRIYADDILVGRLSDIPDIYGVPCKVLSPGSFQVLSVGDICSGRDRIRVVTEIPGLLHRRMTSYYVHNYLCPVSRGRH